MKRTAITVSDFGGRYPDKRYLQEYTVDLSTTQDHDNEQAKISGRTIETNILLGGSSLFMTDEPSDVDSAVNVERRSPDEVFGLLSSEVRVGILRTLGETPNKALTFSELYDRVEMADSGNFNYHLDQLMGVFVRESSGYELTHAGERIIGAIHAGTYTTNATVEPIQVGWNCLLCGSDMIAEYTNEKAVFRCVDCNEGARFSFPTGSLDQFAREELPYAFARWWHHLGQQFIDGFCSYCAGRMEGELVRLPGGTEDDPKPSQAEFECRRCGAVAIVSGATIATFHPVVEGFFAEHGFDVWASHPSQVWGEMDAFDSAVLSEEPPRIEMQFEYEDEMAVAEIEPDATISRVQRRSQSEHDRPSL